MSKQILKDTEEYLRALQLPQNLLYFLIRIGKISDKAGTGLNNRSIVVVQTVFLKQDADFLFLSGYLKANIRLHIGQSRQSI